MLSVIVEINEFSTKYTTLRRINYRFPAASFEYNLVFIHSFYIPTVGRWSFRGELGCGNTVHARIGGIRHRGIANNGQRRYGVQCSSSAPVVKVMTLISDKASVFSFFSLSRKKKKNKNVIKLCKYLFELILDIYTTHT